MEMMRKNVFIIGIILFLFFLFLSGCDTLRTEKDSLTVNVMTMVTITLLDEKNQQIDQNIDGAAVSIEIIKNGQDRFVYDRILQKGICQATASFTLTKGQYVECKATVPKGYQEFVTIVPAYAMLLWETVEAGASMGGVYNWYNQMTIVMKPSMG